MIINAIKDGVGITGGGSGAKPPVLEELNATSNGTYTPSDGVDGFSPVNVNVPIPTFTTEELSVTANGTYTPSTDGYSKVEVNVPTPEPKLQAKSSSTTITSNGTSTITLQPDSNYDGLSSASVTITTNVESSGGGKYVVPNGMKFAYSKAVNPDDFDVSQVTDMSYMFYSCSGLTSLDLSGFNTSSVTNMSNMFNFSRIASINMAGLDTSNVTSMEFMFGQNFLNNGFIMSIDFSMCNMSKVTNMNNMFGNLTNLTDLNMNGAILPKMDITNWKLDTCTKLTAESLVSVLNALPQLDEGQSYTCTIGSDNLAKLTDQQKAIATNKHWVLN